MKYMKQLLIIAVIAFIGETLNYFIPLPIPGSIYGIVILFGALYFKVLKVEQVSGAGKFLLELMPLMFIAPAAKLVSSWDVIKGVLWQGALITIITTLAGMAIIGRITQFVIRHDRKKAGVKTMTDTENVEKAVNEKAGEENA